MGNRAERRIRTGFPVKVFGIDLNGNPFKQTAHAYNVSRGGACLEGVSCLRGPGEMIEVEYRGEKSRSVVVWVGIPGTPEYNRIGVRKKDYRNTWGCDLPGPGPDNFTLPDSAARNEARAMPGQLPMDWQSVPYSAVFQGQTRPREAESERRQYRRYAIEGSATFQVRDSNVRTWGKVSDLSRGGCYVESYVPFPAKTELHMMLEVDQVRVVAEGVVKVAYPGLGMGIEFTKVADEDIQRLEQITSDPVNGRAPARTSESSSQELLNT